MTSRHAYPAKIEKDWTHSLPYTVDPNGKAEFTTIADALVTADAELPAGQSIVLKLTMGAALTETTITLPSSRHVFIGCDTRPTNVASNEGLATDTSKITANFVLPANTAPTRRQFTLFNATFHGNITAGSNWKINLVDVKLTKECEIGRTHGAAGVTVEISRCRNGGAVMEFGANEFISGGVHVHDTDAPPSIMAGEVFIHDCHDMSLESVDANGVFLFVGACKLRFVNNTLWLAVATNYSLIDCNNTACKIEWTNTKLWTKCVFGTNTINLYKNCASAIISYDRADFTFDSSLTPSFVSSGVATETIRSLTCTSFTIPTSAGCGTVWTDRTTAKPRILFRTGGSNPIWRDLSMPKYYVDPDITTGVGAYRYVNDAYAAANAEEAAGYPIELYLATGKNHVLSGTLSPVKTRNLFIYSGTRSVELGSTSPPSTRIDGTITLTEANDQPSRRILAFQNLIVKGTINGNGNHQISLSACELYCTINRTHTVGFPAGGCWLSIFNCTNNGAAFTVVDSDAAIFGFNAMVVIKNSHLYIGAGTGVLFAGGASVKLEDSTVEITSDGGAFVDFASLSATSAIVFNNSSFKAEGNATLLKNIGSSLSAYWHDLRVSVSAGKVVTIGNPGTNTNAPLVLGDTAPTSPPAGTIWTNPSTKLTATYVYHASYPFWKNSSWKPGEAFVDGAVGDATASTGAFATAVQAYNCLDNFLAAGAEMLILMADGTYSANIDVGTDHPVKIRSLNYRGAIITGTVTLPAKASYIKTWFENVELQGTQYIKDGRQVYYSHCCLNTTPFDLNPSGGSVGYAVYIDGSEVWAPTITETASSSGGRVMKIRDSVLYFDSTSAVPVTMYDLDLYLENVTDDGNWWAIGDYAVFDFKSESGSSLYMYGVSALYSRIGATSGGLFANASATKLYMANVEFTDNALVAGTFEFGTSTFNTIRGAMKIRSTIAPSNPLTDTEWFDTAIKEILTWDGTYWGQGLRKRKEVFLVLGSGVASADIGFDVPTGAHLISACTKMLQTCTGEDGCTKLGLGTVLDPDLYGLTPGLSADQKNRVLNGTFADGGGADLILYACDNAGSVAGTVTGSGEGNDVEVLVYFDVSADLP